MQQKEDLGQKCNWQSNRVCRGGRKKNQAQVGEGGQQFCNRRKRFDRNVMRSSRGC
jgi:hypothetical protein